MTHTHQPEPELVPAKEAFRRLNIGQTTGFALIGSGALETVLIGRKRMVKTKSLHHVVEHGAEVPPAPKKSDQDQAAA